MNKTVKKIWDIVSTVLVALVILAAVALVAVKLSGMHAYTVLSGSMEPTYHVGSLVFVKPADPLSIQAGDPITYLIAEKTVVTHRCVEVLPDEDDPSVVRFRTKGDANDAEDGTLVHSSNLIGKVVFSVPLLGFAANTVQHPPGSYIAIALAAAVVLLAFWPDDDKKEGKQSQPQDESGENIERSNSK